jgi:hypothetical protein
VYGTNEMQPPWFEFDNDQFGVLVKKVEKERMGWEKILRTYINLKIPYLP